MCPSDEHYAHWVTPAEQECLVKLLEKTPHLDTALVTLLARLKGNVVLAMPINDLSGMSVLSERLALNPSAECFYEASGSGQVPPAPMTPIPALAPEASTPLSRAFEPIESSELGKMLLSLEHLITSFATRYWASAYPKIARAWSPCF